MTTAAKVSLIAAMASNRVIGKDNQLPWRYKADLAHFKRVTMGKPVIMGRLTYQSIGKPLPGRHNIVVSRDPEFQISGVSVCGSLEEALLVAETADEVTEIMIIGGGQLYQQALGVADRVYLTEIRHDFDGDAYFPELDPHEWQEAERVSQPVDAEHPYPYDFVRYQRLSG